MSTVIKVGSPGKILRRLTTVDLADHLAEAKAIIDDAQARADRTMSQAEQEAARIRKTSRDSGYMAGLEEGQREGRKSGEEAGRREAFEEATARFAQEQSALIDSLQKLLTEFTAFKEELGASARRDLLVFAVRIARQLTYDIGGMHCEAAQANLERALSLVEAKSDVRIRAHPSDVDSLRRFAADLHTKTAAGGVVTIMEDSSIVPGGCRVETDRTEVDATLETQIEELSELLLGKVGAAPSEGSHG